MGPEAPVEPPKPETKPPPTKTPVPQPTVPKTPSPEEDPGRDPAMPGVCPIGQFPDDLRLPSIRDR